MNNLKNIKFISNNTNQTYKVINKLLSTCKSFKLNVAFITWGGYQILAKTFNEINKKGIKGKILTTTYQNLTDPKVIEEFHNFNSFEIKVVDSETIKNKSINDAFHPKGYIFEFDDYYNVLIGSVNITQKALKTNIEWSLLAEIKKTDILLDNILDEFDLLWNNVESFTNAFLESYRQNYISKKRMKNIIIPNLLNKKNQIKPNKFQNDALNNLKSIREQNKRKALLVAATGTGKTYLSAFDVKEFNSNKTLFVVHREEILKKSKESFEKVIQNKTISFFNSNEKNKDDEIVFASQQTLHRHLQEFDKNEFDYIIIDEAHHCGAITYQKIINYFEPKFLLGMTATPERMDNFNIYELFDYNVAFDLRLKDAINNDFVCSFNYFGISDINSVDLEDVDISKDIDLIASKMMIHERVDYIIEQMNIYKYDGEKMYCIAFCVDQKHANYMASEFNKRGIKSASLISDLNSKEREQILNDFQNSNNDLKVVFAVDILNEGIDIPKINLVLLLRPTNSPIIFLQQLGRGLRKDGEKSFLTVLDFIANHNKTYLIPYALASFNSVINETSLCEFVKNDFQLFSNLHIQFDEISKDRILNSIKNLDFDNERIIKEQYQAFKILLNNKPILYMCDYLVEGSPDVLRIAKKYKNYLWFVAKIENDSELFDLLKNEKFEFYLSFLTKLLPIKRVNEIALLLHSIQYNKYSFSLDEAKKVINKHIKDIDDDSVIHTFKFLNCELYDKKQIENMKYKVCINENNKTLKFTNDFIEVLNNDVFKKYIVDCLEYGLNNYLNEFKNMNYFFPFLKLWSKYFMSQVALSINWKDKISSFSRNGIFFDKHNQIYIFINLIKNENIKDNLKYKDEIDLKSRNIIKWDSPNSTSQRSSVGQKIINHQKENRNIHVFIRKYSAIKGKSQPYYYLGLANVKNYKNNNPISFELKLHNKLNDEVFFDLIE